jgi:predicted CopG family antitoxin
VRNTSTPGTFRRPVRVTITIPHNAYQSLVERSKEEGRSLSNLAAFLLETSLASSEAIAPRKTSP